MKLRSGKIISSTNTPRRVVRTKRRARVTKQPTTIAGIVKAIAAKSQEKKRFEVGRASATSVRTFGSYLIGSEINQGGFSFNRIGDTVTLTRIYVKCVLEHSIISTSATVPTGPLYSN